jgi:hypothetical protein
LAFENSFATIESVTQMFSAWIKIDDSLPWIELEEVFRTKDEAQRAAKRMLTETKIRITMLNKQEKRIRTAIKVGHYDTARWSSEKTIFSSRILWLV